MSNEDIKVKKRNGSVEPLQLAKIHEMVSCACEGLSGVSVSQVEMASGIQFYDGISTNEIQEILIKSASDLISLEHPNYQYVAARLLLFSIRKKIYGGRIDMPPLKEHVRKCVDLGVYDSAIFDKYSEEELDKANSFIDHDRDFLFTYAGLRQVVDKYLVQDRVDRIFYETPQFMYIMIALTGFGNYPKEKRMSYVKRYYDAISKHKINIPTPVLAGVRTNLRQFASCTLLDCGDSLESIIATDAALMRYASNRAGIGLNVGRIRGIGSKIRNGEVISTGLVPFIRKFQSTLESCNQGGLRKTSATVHCPIWHQEIEDIIVLKNNKGNEENRARNLDYSIVISKLFYERFIKNEKITLFSPHNVPGLYDAFGTPDFDDLYVKYEKDKTIPKKEVSAQELIVALLNERSETGRIYILNIDHANEHSSFKDKIEMSNLCVAGDTEIKIRPDGNSDIDIQIQDLQSYLNIGNVEVLSYNIETNTQEWKQITAFAQTSPKSQVMKITNEISETNLVVTPDHKIFTKNRGYVMAKDLTEEDEFVFDNGDVVSGLKTEHLEEEIPVYDITVDGNHNFFANGILISNCQEITLPTKPLEHIDDENGAIALCILSALNVGQIKSDKELEECCDLAVRFLEELIDYQSYPVKAAEISTKNRRSLGIGIIGLAHYLAKLGYSYEEQKAWDACHMLGESIQYYLLKASMNIAKEKGACEYFNRLKYSDGILPIDTYKKDVDEISSVPYQHDWERLRKDIMTYGLRHSTLTALMPGESCLFWEHKVKTIDGFMDFHQIAEHGGLDWKEIEFNDSVGWYDLKTPIQVETQSGYKQVDKLYFNGNKEVATIEFENGKIIKCTPNHKFLVKQEDGSTVWKRVYEFNENDDVVEISGELVKVKSIKFEGEILPTYDIEVPEVHQYNCEGLVSHNSSLVLNATNGIEPPREYMSIKRRLKQIVPQYSTLKNNYTLLWDMKSNKGYLNVVAVLQKFFDQAISVNWNYNPEHYPNNMVPMSEIVSDFLYAYKTGAKTAYYLNTYDGAKDNKVVEDLINEILEEEEGTCDGCTI